MSRASAEPEMAGETAVDMEGLYGQCSLCAAIRRQVCGREGAGEKLSTPFPGARATHYESAQQPSRSLGESAKEHMLYFQIIIHAF